MSAGNIKKGVVFVFAGLAMYFLAVNLNVSSDMPLYFSDDTQISQEAPLSKEAAMNIAQTEVKYRARFTKNSKWTVKSDVVDAFPVFIDGIPSVSYYECKVKTGNRDAGYILVNVNKTDLLISESTQDGITLTERYRAKLGRDDFNVLRYDWFRSLAVEKQSNPSLPGGKILAAIGLNEASIPHKAIDNFRASASEKRCFPYYSRESLHEYYQNLYSRGYSIGMADIAWAANYRDITAELRHKCWCNRNNECFHTPRWNQILKSNGHAIGCGPTAWTIVYGYWAKCKNYNRLFDGDVNKNYKQCMTDVHRYTDTRDTHYKGQKMSYTPIHEMRHGIKYAINKGYKRSTCERKQILNEYSKFDAVHPYIKADKPVIMLIHDDSFGFPNHYVVIEKATKRQKLIKIGRDRWDNRDVFFTVNIGNGGESKEIWTREAGRNDHRHYSTFDVFLIDLK